MFYFLANDVDNKNKEILRLENELFIRSGETSMKKSSSKEKRKSSFREKKLQGDLEELEKTIVSSKQEINQLTELKNQLWKKVGYIQLSYPKKNCSSEREKLNQAAISYK